jgi:hypothetical protein
MGTEDQGWVAHFLLRALAGETITLYGDGRQVRDVCEVGDTCAAYIAAMEQIGTVAGRAFNWGGGPSNAVSLLALIAEIGRITGKAPDIAFADWRAGDQRWFVADTRAIDTALGLPRRTPSRWPAGSPPTASARPRPARRLHPRACREPPRRSPDIDDRRRGGRRLAICHHPRR